METENASSEDQRTCTEEKVESTAGQIEGTEDQTKEEIATQASRTSTPTPTSMIFGDDETIATLHLNMNDAYSSSYEKLNSFEIEEELQESFKKNGKLKRRETELLKKKQQCMFNPRGNNKMVLELTHEWKSSQLKLHSSSGSEEKYYGHWNCIGFTQKGSQLTLLLGEELASPRSNSSW
ncbi:hypothetical protein Tco_1476486 [Tanacetum coccineum]